MNNTQLLFFATLISIAPLCTAESLNGKQPNIVLFLADDLGWTGLGCFGSDFYETPNLDALAERSVRFTNAYSACTVCSPTRASLLTGMYPARLRCTDFIAGQNRPYAKMRIPDWTKQLESKHVTIAETLKSAGYKTGHVGKWHLNAKSGPDQKGTLPAAQGFDVSISSPPGTRGYQLRNVTSSLGTTFLTDWLTDKACDFVQESGDQPYFLYFAYNVPHTPIQGRDDLVEYFKSKVKPDATHHNPVYAAMVKSMDESVGRVLKTIKESGNDKNTVVIFVSDNGGLTQRYGKHDDFTENLPLRRGKGSAYEGGVRVPAIVHWPGLTKPGVCDEPIMTIDFYPTVLDALDLDGDSSHNESMDGESIKSLLTDPTSKLDRILYWHYPHYHAGGDGPYSAIRQGDYRLIEFHEDNSIRLFNLAEDIGEQNDLSNRMADKAKAMRTSLRNWRKSIDAQMPTPNPDYDPHKATKVAKKRK